MEFIRNNFFEFLNNYSGAKLGFIVSQSNVESFLRTEFAWYLAEKFHNYDNYKIFVELHRIDLNVFDLTENVRYIIEFGHMVNLHNIFVEKCFEQKMKLDEKKLPQKLKRTSYESNKEFLTQFVHINMLTEFKIGQSKLCEIEEDSATFLKYGKKAKAKYNSESHPEWKAFPFIWRRSYGNFNVHIQSKLI